MQFQVIMYWFNFILNKHIFIAAYLGMTEAICTESKTVLCCSIKNKLALGIFMLTAFKDDQFAILIFKPWLIQVLLTIMWIGFQF